MNPSIIDTPNTFHELQQDASHQEVASRSRRPTLSRRDFVTGLAALAAKTLAEPAQAADNEIDKLRKEIDLPGKEFLDELRGVCDGDKDSVRAAINSLRAAYNTDNRQFLHEEATASPFRRYTANFMAETLLAEDGLTDNPEAAEGNFINKDRFHTLLTSDTSEPEKNPLPAYNLVKGGYHVCTAVVADACSKYGIELPTEPNTPDAWRAAIELLGRMQNGFIPNPEDPNSQKIEPESKIRLLIVGIATGVVSFEDFDEYPLEKLVLVKAMNNILRKAATIDFEHKNIDRSPNNIAAIDDLLSDYSDDKRFGDDPSNLNGASFGKNYMARHGLSRESWDITNSIEGMKQMLDQRAQNTAVRGIV